MSIRANRRAICSICIGLIAESSSIISCTGSGTYGGGIGTPGIGFIADANVVCLPCLGIQPNRNGCRAGCLSSRARGNGTLGSCSVVRIVCIIVTVGSRKDFLYRTIRIINSFCRSPFDAVVMRLCRFQLRHVHRVGVQRACCHIVNLAGDLGQCTTLAIRNSRCTAYGNSPIRCCPGSLICIFNCGRSAIAFSCVFLPPSR